MRTRRFYPGALFFPSLLLAAAAARADIFYVADNGSSSVEVIGETGTVTTLANNVPGACGIACDTQGNIYSLDLNQGRVYKITKTGLVAIFATGLRGPEALAFNSHGDLFVACIDGTVARITRAGAVSTFATLSGQLYGVAIDADDNVFVSNHDTGIISKITKAGQVSVYADATGGAGTYIHTGPLTNPSVAIPRFSGLGVLAFDSHGDLFAAMQNSNVILKVDKLGGVTPYASGISDPTDIAFDSHGDIYVASASGNTILKVPAANTLTTYATGLARPFGLASIRPLYKPAPSLAALSTTDPAPALPAGFLIALCAPAVLLVIAILAWLLAGRKRASANRPEGTE